jgi:hypothetical protein
VKINKVVENFINEVLGGKSVTQALQEAKGLVELTRNPPTVHGHKVGSVVRVDTSHQSARWLSGHAKYPGQGQKIQKRFVTGVVVGHNPKEQDHLWVATHHTSTSVDYPAKSKASLAKAFGDQATSDKYAQYVTKPTHGAGGSQPNVYSLHKDALRAHAPEGRPSLKQRVTRDLHRQLGTSESTGGTMNVQEMIEKVRAGRSVGSVLEVEEPAASQDPIAGAQADPQQDRSDAQDAVDDGSAKFRVELDKIAGSYPYIDAGWVDQICSELDGGANAGELAQMARINRDDYIAQGFKVDAGGGAATWDPIFNALTASQTDSLGA